MRRLFIFYFFIIFIFICLKKTFAHPADPGPILSKYSLCAKTNITSQGGWDGMTIQPAPSGLIGAGNNFILDRGLWGPGARIKFTQPVYIGNNLRTISSSNTMSISFTDTLRLTGAIVNTGSFPINYDTLKFTQGQPYPIVTFPTLSANEIDISNPLPISYNTPLPAGNYDDANGNLILQGGTYNFNSISGFITVRKNSSEVTRIIVKSHLSGIRIVEENGNYGKVLIYTPQTADINFGISGRIDATVVAPNAKVILQNGGTMHGQIHAYEIFLAQGYDGGTGSFEEFDPPEITLKDADIFTIPEAPGTRFASIPIGLGGSVNAPSSVDYSISQWHLDPYAIDGGIDFNSNYQIAKPNGTINFNTGETHPATGDSVWIQVIDDALTTAHSTEWQTEYFLLKLFNPVVAILENDPNAHEIKTTGSVVDTLVFLIPIINDDFNNKPDAINDTITVNEGDSTNINVTLNDIDIDIENSGDSLTVIIESNAQFGTLSVNSDGTIKYKHDDSENFSDFFQYKITDNFGETDIATVFININPLNDNAPITNSDSIYVNEGATATTITVGQNTYTTVLHNDSDIDGMNFGPVTAILVTDVSHGTLILNSDGTFNYTHDDSESFSDFFIYKTFDSVQEGNSDTVFISIASINDNSPLTISDTIVVNEGDSTSILKSGANSLLANDSDIDNNSSLEAIIITNVKHGTFNLNKNGTFIYKHNHSENFSDSLTYQTSDGLNKGNIATVTIIINPVNDNTPTTTDDIINVASTGGTSTILADGSLSVLQNDNDVDFPHDSLTAKLVMNPSHGTLTLNANGTFTYTHDGTGAQLDTAAYIANDTANPSHISDTTFIYIGINLTYTNKPDAINDTIFVLEGGEATLLHNDSSSILWNDNGNDPLDVLNITLMSDVTFGNLDLDQGGTFSYTHNGSENFSDQFQYIITDLGNQKDTATVIIIITPVNDNTPVALADTILVDEGGTQTVLKSGNLSLISNDTDEDIYDLLTASLKEPANYGNITVNSDGTFSYTHNGDEVFSDHFIYTVSDSANPSHTADQLVVIIVNPVNDNSPVTLNDTIIVNEGDSSTTLSNGSTSLLANDYDNDTLDQLFISTIISQSIHGFFNFDSAGTFIYVHNGTENFLDSVIYEVSDQSGKVTNSKLIIIINPVNDNAPVNQPDTIFVIEGQSVDSLINGQKSVLHNDDDIDGMDNITVTLSDSTVLGSLKLNSDGTFLYTHSGVESYNDQFTYSINDGKFSSNPIEVVIIIQPIPKPLISNGASYHDSNGDGFIDSIFIEFLKPVSIYNTAGDTITKLKLKWSNKPEEYNILDEMITFSENNIRMHLNTSDLFNSEIRTSGDLILIGTYTLLNPITNSYYDTSVAYPVIDKAPPVLQKALYKFNMKDAKGSYFDLLKITFSEKPDSINTSEPFTFNKTDESQYSMILQYMSKDSLDILFKVLEIKDADYADTSDSVRINFTQNIGDLFKNIQLNNFNRKVPLMIESEEFDFKIQSLSQIGKNIQKLPQELTINSKAEFGTAILLTPYLIGNEQQKVTVPGYLIEREDYEIIILDALGNIVAQKENKNSDSKNLYSKFITLKSGTPAIVINWDNHNSNERLVGSGAYIAIVKFINSSTFTSEYKTLINIKTFK